MNKKIKELVQRAEALTEQEWHRLAQSTDGMPRYQDLFNQMFAELIVKECALQCVHNEDMDLIEKHFGVEL